jgi:hypothetical protein
MIFLSERLQAVERTLQTWKRFENAQNTLFMSGNLDPKDDIPRSAALGYSYSDVSESEFFPFRLRFNS